MPLFTETPEYFIETTAGGGSMGEMHYHHSYELYFLEAGSRDYFVEDKVFSVSSGSFVLISPSKLHRTGGLYALRTLVGFSDDFLRKTYHRTAAEHLVECFNRILITPSEEKLKVLKFLLKQLSLCREETEFAIYLGGLLNELLNCQPVNTSDQHINSIIEYINKNFATIDSIEQIANRFYISKYHLCRIFKHAMKMTVIDYLNNIRIKNACNFLESSDKGILEISQLCGFNSSAYFSNVFKKTTSLSPSEYKNRNQRQYTTIK